MDPAILKGELAERRWRPYFEENQKNENGPTALLRDLTMWLEGDAVDLYWNWSALQDQCGKVWQKLERSLSEDLECDSGWNLDPKMGLHILEWAAADEHEKGCIARDDPTFAAPLRQCFDAIQATIFEVQEEPFTNLGIFAAQPDTTGSHIYGGDVCLTRLLKEDKNFINYIRSFAGRTLADMYAIWPNETFAKGQVFRLLKSLMVELEAEIEKQTRKALVVWVESEQRYFRFTEDDKLVPDDDAMDPCADCLRCKRRSILYVTPMYEL
jgi:hypothetical protein